MKLIILKIIGQPHDELLTTTDSRYNHYKANEDRNGLKDGLISRIILEKRLVSNITKLLLQSNRLMQYSRTCTEILEDTQDWPKQKLFREKK